MDVSALPAETRNMVRQTRRNGATVGVVPTMGALHVGHVRLMEAARRDCDFVIATIFVNPTQFGPDEDFERYPRTLEADLQKCAIAGVDLAFTPATSDMYLQDAECDVRVNVLTQQLEGACRPGHFDGVTTVMAKLFNITVPDRAYFGQKDYQQQLVIKRMVLDLNWGVEIVTCPTVREADGLAMSSRNRFLTPQERDRALVLYRSLTLAQRLADSSRRPSEVAREMRRLIESQNGVELDYAVVVDCDTLEPVPDDTESAVAILAAKLGKTRLIDNQILQFR